MLRARVMGGDSLAAGGMNNILRLKLEMEAIVAELTTKHITK
jgi:hypothetical protein